MRMQYRASQNVAAAMDMSLRAVARSVDVITEKP